MPLLIFCCSLFCDQRTATDVPQNEQNKSSPGQNSKRQRVGLDDCSLQNNQEENHIDTNKDKLLIRSSTFAKLNSFKKGLDSRNLSNEMEETSSVKFPCTSFQGVISEKDTTKSSENGTGWTNMDEDSKEVEDMEIVNGDNLREDFIVSQFAHKSDSVSHRGSNQTSRIRDVIEKTQSNSLKRLNGRAKSPYTPLELQFLEVKSKYPDVILLVECGYRYRFFGDDAEVNIKLIVFLIQCTPEMHHRHLSYLSCFFFIILPDGQCVKVFYTIY